MNLSSCLVGRLICFSFPGRERLPLPFNSRAHTSSRPTWYSYFWCFSSQCTSKIVMLVTITVVLVLLHSHNDRFVLFSRENSFLCFFLMFFRHICPVFSMKGRRNPVLFVIVRKYQLNIFMPFIYELQKIQCFFTL